MYTHGVIQLSHMHIVLLLMYICNENKIKRNHTCEQMIRKYIFSVPDSLHKVSLSILNMELFKVWYTTDKFEWIKKLLILSFKILKIMIFQTKVLTSKFLHDIFEVQELN